MKVIKWLDKYFEEILMAVLLTAIVLVMFVQIFLRYVVGHALSFPEEVCRYMFIWMSFLGISYSVRCRNSLQIDILETLVPKIKPILNLIANIVFLGFCGVMIWQGIISVAKIYDHNQTSAAIALPMWIVYAAFLVGCCLSVIRLIQVIYEDFILKHRQKKQEQLMEDETEGRDQE